MQMKVVAFHPHGFLLVCPRNGENINAVKRYIEDPMRPFDPYDFRIQF